jgi:hypothetical protein
MEQRGYTLTVVLVLAAAMLAGSLGSGTTGMQSGGCDCVCYLPGANSNVCEGERYTSSGNAYLCTEVSYQTCEWQLL